MLKAVPPLFPKRDRRVKAKPAVPAPVAPTLIGATYVVATSVTLVFDRAVDASAMDVDAVVVRDGEEHCVFRGEPGVETPSPTTVRVRLYIDESDDFPNVTLSVASSNGLVALDGAAWSGCSGVALPFG